jgi:hypothetical protein
LYKLKDTGAGNVANFEIAVYNEEVKRLVAEGESHRHLSKDWADIHYLKVDARNDAHVRQKL